MMKTALMNDVLKKCFWALCYLLIMSDIACAVSGKPLRLGVPLYTVDAPVTEEFIVRLNTYLRPDDILFVTGEPQTVHLLKLVKTGKVAVIRQSVAGLKKDLDFLISQKVSVDYLCYNHEAWESSHTPGVEKEDPVKAVINARKLADEYRLQLILVPDTAITLLSSGADMAPYADIFIVQFQRWQLLKEDEFQKLVDRTVRWVKTGNPEVPIFAQLSTNPPLHRHRSDKEGHVTASAAEMMAKVKTIERFIDGAGFLLRAEDNGFERFFELLEIFRPKNDSGLKE